VSSSARWIVSLAVDSGFTYLTVAPYAAL